MHIRMALEQISRGLELLVSQMSSSYGVHFLYSTVLWDFHGVSGDGGIAVGSNPFFVHQLDFRREGGTKERYNE